MKIQVIYESEEELTEEECSKIASLGCVTLINTRGCLSEGRQDLTIGCGRKDYDGTRITIKPSSAMVTGPALIGGMTTLGLLATD